MLDSILEKAPAFFPFVSAEVFFEAEAQIEELDVDQDLNSELDAILGEAAPAESK